MEFFQRCRELDPTAVTLPEILNIINELKPINAICILKQAFQAKTLKAAGAAIVKLLELWNMFWPVTADTIKSLGELLAWGLRKLVYVCAEFKTWLSALFRSQLRTRSDEEQIVTEETDDLHFQADGDDDITVVDGHTTFTVKQPGDTGFGFSTFVTLVSSFFGTAKDSVVKALSGIDKPIRSLVSSILSLSIPLVSLFKGGFDLKATGFADRITKLGNCCKGWESIAKTYTGFSDLIKHGIGVLTGDVEEGPRADMVKKLEALQVKLKSRYEEFDRDPTSLLLDKDFLSTLKADFESVEGICTDMCKLEGNTGSFSFLWSNVKHYYVTLSRKYNEITKNLIGKQVPVTIWLYGASGVGKSSVCRYLENQFSLHHGSPLFTFPRNSGDKYFPTYNGQHIFMYDDFGANRANLDHNELDLIYSPNSFLLTQAGIPDKGQRFSSRYVIINSNHGIITTSEVLTDPTILDRRRDFVLHVEDKMGLPPRNVDGRSYWPRDHYKDDFSHLQFTLMDPIRQNNSLKAIKPITIQEVIREAYELQCERYDSFTKACVEKCELFKVKGVAPDSLPPATHVAVDYVAPAPVEAPRQQQRNRGNRAGQRHRRTPPPRFDRDAEAAYFNRTGDWRTEGVRRFMEDDDSVSLPDARRGVYQRDVAVADDDWAAAIDAQEQHLNARHFGVEVTYQARSLRDTPYMALLVGPPGVGKSTIFSTLSDELYVKEDEFADTITNLRRVKDLVWATDAGKQQKPVVMACNEEQLLRMWEQCGYASDTLEAFYRRVDLFKFSWAKKSQFLPFSDRYKKEDLTSPDMFVKCVDVHRFEFGKARVGVPYSIVHAHVSNGKPRQQMVEDYQLFCPKPATFEPELQVLITLPSSHKMPDSAMAGLQLFMKHVRGNAGDIGLIFKIMKTISTDYPHCTLDTFDEIMLALASYEVKTHVPTASIHFENGVKYYVWFDECVRVCKEQQEFRTAEYEEMPKAISAVPAFIRSRFPLLDVLGLFIKIGVGVLTVVYDGVKPVSDVEHEGWGEDMDEDDPLPYTPPHKGKTIVARVPASARQSSKRNVYDPSGYGASVNVDRPIASEARHKRMMDTYSEGNKGIPVTISSEAGAPLDYSYNGLRVKQKVLKVVQDEPEPLTHEAMYDPGADAVLATIQDNIVSMLDKDGKHVNYGCMLKKRCGVTVQHSANRLVSCQYKGVVYPIKAVQHSVLHDQFFFTLTKQSPECRDITGHLLPSRKSHEKIDGNWGYFCRFVGKMPITHTVNFRESIVRSVEGTDRYGVEYIGSSVGISISPIQTQRGDCGLPLIIINTAYAHKFVGFHTAANQSLGYGSRLFKEDLPELLEHESDFTEVVCLRHQGVKLFDEPIEIENSLITIVGQPVRDDGQVYCQYYPEMTKYWRSPFQGLDVGDRFEPAVLTGKDTRTTTKNVLFDAIMKWDVPAHDIDLVLLDQCVESIGQFCAERIKASRLNMRVLTKTEAINRCTDITGSNPIYRYSSAGFPWTMHGVNKKNSLFEQRDDGLFHIAKTDQGERLRHAVDHLITTAKEGKRSAVVFHGALKDEPLKLKKIYDCTATRSITASPVDYTIAHRKYFHTVSAAFTTLFNELPVKIGINPLSTDWHTLYLWHAEVGTVGFDCDFAKWDATVPIELMERLPRIYNRIYQVCDKRWKPEDDVVRTNLHAVMHGAFVLYHDVILKMPGGQMTGQPQTALDNSLINWVYALYVWMKLARRHAPALASFYHFNQQVRASFYGDDNILSFNPAIRTWFNFLSYSAVCAELGLTVTPADKGDKVYAFREIHELSFLKRTFAKLENSPYYVGALSCNSLQRMLDWTTGRPHRFWLNQQAIAYDDTLIGDITVNLLLECAPHGREFFRRVRDWVLDRADTYAFELPHLPDYDAACLHYVGVN